MSAAFTIGHQAVCLCVLVVVILFVALQKRSDARLSVVLVSAILLMCSCSLFILALLYEGGSSRLQEPMIHAAALLFAVVAAVVMVASYLFSNLLGRTSVPWSMLVVSLVPYWLAGLGYTIVGDLALASAASTISLLITFFFYQYEIEQSGTASGNQAAQRHVVLLQEQMRPHFLFNSLATIHGLCDIDPAKAAEGVENLSGYLRKNIEGLGASELVPFERELEHVEEYVALAQMNSALPFEVVYDLQVVNFMVPALSIQPLVEHAVAYDIRARRDGCMVILSTELHGDFVRIVVEDNGQDSQEGLSQQQKDHAQHSLEYVQERLETQCGGSLHKTSDEHGTRIVVLLPCEVPSAKQSGNQP